MPSAFLWGSAGRIADSSSTNAVNLFIRTRNKTHEQYERFQQLKRAKKSRYAVKRDG